MNFKNLDAENLYLIASIVLTLVLPFSLFQTEGDISTIGNSLLNLWLPIWILALFIPFYGIIQIVKRTDDWNIKFWIGLLLNIINFFFILNFFSLKIFPE